MRSCGPLSGNVAWCALCLLTQPPLVGALPPPVSSFPGLSLSPSLLPRRNSSPPALPAAGQGLGCWALTIPWCCRGNHRPFLGCSPVLPPGFCAGRPSATSLRPSIQRTFLPAACCRLCGLFRVFAFALRRVGSPFGPPPRLVPLRPMTYKAAVDLSHFLKEKGGLEGLIHSQRRQDHLQDRRALLFACTGSLWLDQI